MNSSDIMDMQLKVYYHLIYATDRCHLSNEGLALLDVLLELGQAGLEELLFLSRELAKRVDLLNTIRLSKAEYVSK